AQTFDDLHDEGGRQARRLLVVTNQRLQIHARSVHAEQPVGDIVGLLPGNATAYDALRCAPQVFDQHDPQGDGNGPQLADGQRLHLLIGVHETAQSLRIETAVAVRDVCPRDAEHTRIADERPAAELGQLPVEARRQIVLDLAD